MPPSFGKVTLAFSLNPFVGLQLRISQETLLGGSGGRWTRS